MSGVFSSIVLSEYHEEKFSYLKPPKKENKSVRFGKAPVSTSNSFGSQPRYASKESRPNVTRQFGTGNRPSLFAHGEERYEYDDRRQSRKGDNWLCGRREVVELLRSDLRIGEVLIQRSGSGESYDEILELSEARGVPLSLTDRSEFEKLFPEETHQGAAASFFSPPPIEFDDLISGKRRVLLVMLDGVTDPHNLGAVIRSAEVFGADGVIIPERRSASLTPAAIKASAGAALRIPTIQGGNLATMIKRLKENDFWIYGTDPSGSTQLWTTDFAERSCIVMGSEGKGMARLTRELCDFLITIPQVGKIGSLNISVSAAIVLFEVFRQREIKVKKVDL